MASSFAIAENYRPNGKAAKQGEWQPNEYEENERKKKRMPKIWENTCTHKSTLLKVISSVSKFVVQHQTHPMQTERIEHYDLSTCNTFGTSSISRKTLTLTAAFFFRLVLLFLFDSFWLWTSNFWRWIGEKCSSIKRIALPSLVRHAATAYIKLLIPKCSQTRSRTHTHAQCAPNSKWKILLCQCDRFVSYFHIIRTFGMCSFFAFSLIEWNLKGFFSIFFVI